MTDDNTIENLRPEYECFLSELVKIPSLRGEEGAAQNFVKRHMLALGLDVQEVHSREDSHSINLCAIMHGSSPHTHRSLVLNAHCDVTPVDFPDSWRHPPYSGYIEDGILHGRGSVDDKAGVAVILMVADALLRQGIRLKGDLLIQSVVDDETSGDGSRALVDAGFIGDGVVICDGTWPERIIHTHLGQLFLDVHTQGKAVAACVEARGINPINICTNFIARLEDQIKKWNNENSDFGSIERPFFCNVGAFHSGEWHGSVPVDARMAIQLGYAHFSAEKILAEVRKIAAEVSERITVEVGTLNVAPYTTEQGSELISTFKKVIEGNTLEKVEVVGVTGHSDMQYFPTRQVCLYGPGGGENAHGVNEKYFLEHLPIVARNLFEFSRHWCDQPKTDVGD